MNAEAILADFRHYLEGLREPPPAPVAEPVPFDLSVLVAQFTALRHDVNLQTKATRTAVDAFTTSKPATPKFDTEDATKPLVKALIEIADSLSLAQKKVSLAAVLAVLPEIGEVEPPKPGFFARLFGAKSAAGDEWRSGVTAAHEKLAPLLAGIADGYALSLRRVEHELGRVGLETIPCEGENFDPELMEVVEAVSADGIGGGTVVEEVRRGYLRNGAVFRFALVKVAR